MAVKQQLTPVQAGFRMPAEWEPQSAIWLSWPHNHATWPGRFRPIPYVFARIVAQISRFESVRINAAARENGLTYGQLMHGLKTLDVSIDRKMLADLAATQPEAFAALAARVKNAPPAATA